MLDLLLLCMSGQIINNCLLFFWTGGNQRDLARAKNLKKQQEQAKGKKKESGASKTQRMER